jgi:hypothetical protein
LRAKARGSEKLTAFGMGRNHGGGNRKKEAAPHGAARQSVGGFMPWPPWVIGRNCSLLVLDEPRAVYKSQLKFGNARLEPRFVLAAGF